MTITGWIIFVVLAACILGTGIIIALSTDGKIKPMIVLFVSLLIVVGLGLGMRWYYTNTASGQRAVIDQRSELNGGLNRRIVIYTANGDILAEYEGQIDIEANDGGYIKFDFEGRRYIYYNCFVESIADIGG